MIVTCWRCRGVGSGVKKVPTLGWNDHGYSVDFEDTGWICSVCGGTGTQSDEPCNNGNFRGYICKHCNATGRQLLKYPMTVACPYCGGSGSSRSLGVESGDGEQGNAG
jgi:hypothetical protein